MIHFGEEVQAARSRGAPLVALETSVVAQGLPHPENLDAARACEDAVRQGGSVPAATAVIDGKIWVGLTSEQLQRLADPSARVMKLGGKDLAMAVASGRSGGTTVSATAELAARAGIRVFATGGIGGVHRGVAEDLDISQDLAALARFPVAVVCAGAKSVLDLPKTLEALESLGVPVVGVGISELPAFYSRSSGLPLEHRVETPAEAARMIAVRMDELQQGGMVFAVPPPEATTIPWAEVQAHVDEALALGRAKGIRGKAVTPFLLAELSRRTHGKSLKANLALLANNARFAGEVAAAYAAIPRSERGRP